MFHFISLVADRHNERFNTDNPETHQPDNLPVLLWACGLMFKRLSPMQRVLLRGHMEAQRMPDWCAVSGTISDEGFIDQVAASTMGVFVLGDYWAGKEINACDAMSTRRMGVLFAQVVTSGETFRVDIPVRGIL